MTTATLRRPTALPRRLAHALDDADGTTSFPTPDDVLRASRRDRLCALLMIHDLHTAPLASLGARVVHQHRPEVAALKQRLEAAFVTTLSRRPVPADLPDDPVQALRTLAARDRLPEVYRWLAKDASYDELVRFLALEGGPDGGFDDLVAACQIGLDGPAKMELATNYWDEMGDGDHAAVHTTLHRQMAAALGIEAVPCSEQPVEGLARSALGGLLATNRALQPEMLGALGLIELQAGPRCRLVLKAFDRLGAPEAAYPFYEVHAEVDPRHGKDWLEKVVAPVVAESPDWGPRIVRGAWWRTQVNAAFFDALTPAVVARAA